MNNQNQQSSADQLLAHNQRMMAGVQNAAPQPSWKAIAEEATELLVTRHRQMVRWRQLAFTLSGYVLFDIFRLVWKMFQ